jgi:two-component system OmpR family response regulator
LLRHRGLQELQFVEQVFIRLRPNLLAVQRSHSHSLFRAEPMLCERMNTLTFDDWRMSRATTQAGRAARLLLVEDDARIAREIVCALSEQACAVETAGTGNQGLEMALAGAYDVIITDRMLPELDGLELIAQLRERGLRTPVLVLSAMGSVSDRVRGLKAGGDDYLAKPFDIEELAARIEVLLRRVPDSRETVLRAGPIVMDLLEHTVYRGGRMIDLLPREFKLLEYMIRRPNQTLTRAMMLQDVWHFRFAPETNLVDVHIGKLRRKLTIPGETEIIVSVRGAGFMLVAHARPDPLAKAAS